ncbi:MAG: T9SS type A sorting domain-containing protein [Candidatus Absconditabacterales bacterium]|jgi:hypothetical protein
MKKLNNFFKKTIFPALMGIWAILLPIVDTVQGQTYTRYYMDSLTNFQTLYPCKAAADTLIFYKPAAFTSGLLHWNCNIPPYNYYADSLCIPNDYNSYSGATGFSCFSGNTLPNKTVFVIFGSSPTHPILHDTIFCLGGSATLSPGNYTSYVWSTNETSPTISVTQSGNYSVTVTDNGCTDTTSAAVKVIVPYEEQHICYVTCDSLFYKNRINFERNMGVGIDSIEIFKETTQDTWVPIGSVPNTDSSFVDMLSNPQLNSNSYKIMIVDSCGNRSSLSPYHKSINLAVDPFQIHPLFTWNNYEGIVVSTYTLYGIQADGQINAVITDLVPASTGEMNLYSWDASNNPYIKFFVGFHWSCGQNQIVVRSNDCILRITNIDKQKKLTDLISIYPTPTNGKITITTNLSIQNIKIYNTLGQIILITKEKSFDMPYRGFYLVDIQTNKGVITKKIIVQ